jgi:hypothetical protein
MPGGIGGGPPPGGGGGGGIIEWRCTRCGRTVGFGNNPPIGQTCACGVRFDRAIGVGGGAGGPPPGMGGMPPPGGGGGPPMAGGGMPPPNMQNQRPPAVRNEFDDRPDDQPNRRGRDNALGALGIFLVLGGIVFFLIFLGICAFGGLMLVILYNKSQENY